MADMSIGEVAKQAGLRTSTLRYYEEIGLLPAPKRVSGRRRYDADVLQRLEVIHTAQQAGFTLAEMRILFDDILTSATPSAQWHTLIQHKLQDLNALLKNVQRMKSLLEDIMLCDGPEMAECITFTGQRHKPSPLTPLPKERGMESEFNDI